VGVGLCHGWGVAMRIRLGRVKAPSRRTSYRPGIGMMACGAGRCVDAPDD